MKRIALSMALVATVAPSAFGAGGVPTLRLDAAKPLTLHGEHFRTRERVFVTLHTTRPYGRVVTTRADGSFSVEFATASARCVSVRAVARGASGDRALLVRARPLCASPGLSPAPGPASLSR